MAALSRAAFERHLRDCLNRLYDPDFLRTAPLAELLGVAGRANTPTLVRRILIEAIGVLEPSASVPLHSRDWRIHDALVYLYVQQMSQEEAAEKMALSPRQVRRDRTAGLRALADLLWERYDLAEREAPPANKVVPPTLRQELAWLQRAPPGAFADLGQVVRGVLDLVQPLTAQQRTRLDVSLPDELPRVAIPAVALRQILLGLLSATIHEAANQRVTLVAHTAGEHVEVHVRRPGRDPEDLTASLDTVRQLVELCRGAFDVSHQEDVWRAVVTLPVFEQNLVLVIDDNADTLQLLQRYTSGTRYQLITTRDPEEALELAEEHAPQIIVLDVMMPQVDGWEVLDRLHRNPATTRTPVVVCTILADADLALSLGAAAFVRKPVTQERFLEALDQVAGEMQPRRG